MTRPGAWPRRLGVAAFASVALLAIGGCKSHKEPRLGSLDVSIETPAGTHRFGTSVEPGLVHIHMSTLSISVHTPSVNVTLAAFAKTPQIMVEPNPRQPNVEFETKGSFYQRRGGAVVPLSGTQADLRGPRGEWMAAQWRIDLGPPLSEITLVSSRPPPATISAIAAIEDETHRFYVPFSIDGERYAIDASFALELERVWSLGSIGGMP